MRGEEPSVAVRDRGECQGGDAGVVVVIAGGAGLAALVRRGEDAGASVRCVEAGTRSAGGLVRRGAVRPAEASAARRPAQSETPAGDGG